MAPILALIIPISESPQGPPGIWPTPPPGIWPTPPGGGSPPLYPSQGPGFPTHPIAPGGGGMPPLYPSQGPGFPTHPIAPGGPGAPVYPSQGPGFPTHPIFLPPTAPVPPTEVWPPLPPEKPAPIEGYYLAYVPALGRWVYVPVDTTKPVVPPEAAPKPV